MMRAAATLLLAALLSLTAAQTAWAGVGDVTYIDADGNTQTAQAIALVGTETTLGQSEQETWYIVDKNIDYTATLTLDGDVNLIRADGCTMTVTTTTRCIEAIEHSLHIYGQTNGTGALKAQNEPGVLGGNDVIYILEGILGIHGGNVTATSFSMSSFLFAAGTLAIAPDLTYTDGTRLYDSETPSAELASLTNVTLQPCLVLADADDNAAAIVANSGKPTAVAIKGRTLYKDGSWNTLCLPFAVNGFDGTPLEGATLMELDTDEQGSNEPATGLDEEGLLTLNFKNVTTGIAAGTPYIVKWEKATEYESNPSAYDIENPVFQGVTITSTTPTAVTSTDMKVTFVGQYSPIEVTDADSYIMLGSQNTLGYAAAGNTLRPFRAHFEISDAQSVKGYKLSFGDEAESIQNSKFINSKFEVTDDAWFSLDGRKLPGKPTEKGIYIHEGVKVVIR